MINQLDLFNAPETNEASLYHGAGHYGFFTINQRAPDEARLKQRSYHNKLLPLVLANLLDGSDYLGGDCYISQASFTKPARRAVHLMSLSCAYVDLDIYAHDAPPLARRLARIERPEDRAGEVLEFCHEHTIPPPSIIIHSGRGLYLKWLFEQSIPHRAKPRWDALQEHLTNRFRDMAADPQARDASRVLRLCGTQNRKGREDSQLVRVVWKRPTIGGSPYLFDFSELCDEVLPYTQAEVHALKAKQAVWDANRAQPTGARRVKPVKDFNAAGREVAMTLWWNRQMDIRELVRRRYGVDGVPAGQRNAFAWVLANALAWTIPQDVANLSAEVRAVFSEIMPSFSATEIRASAASVIGRITEGDAGKGLYRMSNATLRAKLAITPDEERHMVTMGGKGTKPTSKPINEGAMGFAPMANLPYAEYQAETTRRKQLAAKRTNQVRLAASEEKRASARLMRAQGMSFRAIAAALQVSQSSVWEWVR